MISIDSFNDDMYIYSILYTVDDYMILLPFLTIVL
jgi:hypothetical protein